MRNLQWCVVVARFNCSFEAKIRNAQAAGYDAVIVHNVGSNEVKHEVYVQSLYSLLSILTAGANVRKQ